MDRAYQRSGHEGYLRARIQSLEQTSKVGSFPNLYLAHLYARLGDQAHPLHYLEQAYDERDP